MYMQGADSPDSADSQRLHDGVATRSSVSSQGSPPRDWSTLGQWVLAEAVRRATDELAHRTTHSAAPACPPNAERHP